MDGSAVPGGGTGARGNGGAAPSRAIGAGGAASVPIAAGAGTVGTAGAGAGTAAGPPGPPVSGVGGGGGASGGDGGGGSAGGAGAPGRGGAPIPVGGPPRPHPDVGLVLTVCGAAAAEIQALEVTERLNRFSAFSRTSSEEVNHLASRLEKRQAPGKISLPLVLIKNIHALCFWAAKARHQHRTPITAAFTINTLEEALKETEIKETDTGTSPDIKPKVLNEENW